MQTRSSTEATAQTATPGPSQAGARASAQKRPRVQQAEATPVMKKARLDAGGTLEARHSYQQAENGAGFGLFAKAKEGYNVAFRRGETILNIEGCAAFRVRQKNDLYVEWLYENGMVCELKEKGYVMWSGVELNPGKNLPFVDYGVKTHDLSLFSNDSVTPEKANAKCKFEYESRLHRSKKSVQFPQGEIPVQLHLKASRDIWDNQEVLWHYASDGYKEADYSAYYAEPYDAAKHKALILDCTQALMGLSGDRMPKEVMTDEQEFEERRWQLRFASSLPTLTYTGEEEKFIGASVSVMLKDAKTNEAALNAYIKKRLKLAENPSNLMQSMVERLHESGMDYSVDSLFQYCFERNFITPETCIDIMPLKWLAQKLKESPDEPRWIQLLRKRIHLFLIKKDFRVSSIIGRLTTQFEVPNPLKGNRCEWTFSDLIRLSQYPGNVSRNSEEIGEIIKDYEGVTQPGSSAAIWALARFGNIDAIIAIVKKQISHGKPFYSISKAMCDRDIKIPVEGVMRSATEQNLVDFLIKKLSDADRNRYIPAAYLHGEALREKACQSSRAPIRISVNYRQKIRETEGEERLDHLREFLRFFGERNTPRQKLIASAEEVAKGIPEISASRDAHWIIDLFKDCPQDQGWLAKKFPEEMADDEKLLKELANNPGWQKTGRQELMKRAKKNTALLGKILVADRPSHGPDDGRFYSRMAQRFNEQECPHLGGSQKKWLSADIRTLYEREKKKETEEMQD